VSTFTQNAGALAAVDADWVIATDLEEQDGTSTADIQYTASNVFGYQGALGLKASAVRDSNLWVPRFIQGIQYDNSGSVKSGEIFTQAGVLDIPGIIVSHRNAVEIRHSIWLVQDGSSSSLRSRGCFR
jgi:hypothetical protein